MEISNKKELLDITGDLFSLKLTASANSTGLFSNERKIIILFFANNQKFNESDIITIRNNDILDKEFRFGTNSEIEIKIVDATSKEQIEKATVKQNSILMKTEMF